MQIDVITKVLNNSTNVKFAYLFGSYADGTFTPRSDIDVAVYLEDISFDAQLRISFDISRALGKDTDLVVLNKAKNLYLLEDIIIKGVLLKDSDERIDFELKKHHQFLDFVEFKKRIHVA